MLLPDGSQFWNADVGIMPSACLFKIYENIFCNLQVMIQIYRQYIRCRGISNLCCQMLRKNKKCEVYRTFHACFNPLCVCIYIYIYLESYPPTTEATFTGVVVVASKSTHSI